MEDSRLLPAQFLKFLSACHPLFFGILAMTSILCSLPQTKYFILNLKFSFEHSSSVLQKRFSGLFEKPQFLDPVTMNANSQGYSRKLLGRIELSSLNITSSTLPIFLGASQLRLLTFL
jgi:hypothetical protein